VPIQTATPAVEQPFGEIAFFVTGFEMYLAEIGSGNMGTKIYDPISHTKSVETWQGISWSPDGKHLAFGMGPWSDIFLLTIGAKDVVNLTRTENAFEMTPAISPKGKLIAFTAVKQAGDKIGGDIYTMRLDGSQVKLLLDCEQKCLHPDWSPDGKQLVFQMGDDLYTLPVGGGKPNKLISGAVNTSPAWSPDGEWIAFVRSQSSPYDSPSYIYLVKPDGTELHALTGDNLKPLQQLSWSPDSKFIAFENHSSGNQQGIYGIIAIHVESGELFNLFGTAYAPAWRPYDLTKLPTPTATTISDLFDCTNGWTRLKAGEQAQVTGDPGDAPNRVRAEPNLNAAQVGLLDPGTVVTLLRGPVCADGLVWWKISEASLPGGEGYTAEGDGKEYWLQPYK
jgi:Tol biopolymer transport system component